MDGNSIEAVHRPIPSGGEKRSAEDRALTVIKNGSVVSKASSKKSPESVVRQKSEAGSSSASKARTTATSTSRSVPPPGSYQPKQPASIQLQQPPTPNKDVTNNNGDNNNNESGGAKAVVGTLMGAAAGAAIAYAMMKGDSQPETTTPPPSYSEPCTSSPGSEKDVPEYRAIEAAPPSVAPKSTISANDNRYSEYARSVLSKNPRASTIMEGLEHGSRVWGAQRSIYGGGGVGVGVGDGNNSPINEYDMGRRASSGSVYSSSSSNMMRDPMDIPIRAIEPPIDECSECSRSYPNNPSTFISSFKDRPRRSYTSDYSGGGSSFVGSANGHGSVVSSSTLKPSSNKPHSHGHGHGSVHGSAHGSAHGHSSSNAPSHAPSRPASSHRSHSSRSILTIKDIHNSSSKAGGPTASFYSANHSARNIPLPAGSVTTISTSSSRRNSHAHAHAHGGSNGGGNGGGSGGASYVRSSTGSRAPQPQDIPLPASTIFLDGVDVDSHVMPHPHSHHAHSHYSPSRQGGGDGIDGGAGDGAGGSGSRVSRKTHQSSHHTHQTHRSRSSQRSKKSSKFDEPVRPSDSVSQVSTNVSKKSSKSRRWTFFFFPRVTYMERQAIGRMVLYFYSFFSFLYILFFFWSSSSTYVAFSLIFLFFFFLTLKYLLNSILFFYCSLSICFSNFNTVLSACNEWLIYNGWERGKFWEEHQIPLKKTIRIYPNAQVYPIYVSHFPIFHLLSTPPKNQK